MTAVDATPGLKIIRSHERRHVAAGWYDSYQSFGGPDGDAFGPLVVHNESVIAPGAGFPPHAHREAEIVTWIFSGTMEHRDSEGNRLRITPGRAQRMSAGTGIVHSEINPDESVPSHGLQMWVLPDQHAEPSYAELEVAEPLATRRLIPVLSGANAAALSTLNRRDATLWAARLGSGDEVIVPRQGLRHIFVGIGTAELEGAGALGAGDVARLLGGAELTLTAAEDAEILIWQFS